MSQIWSKQNDTPFLDIACSPLATIDGEFMIITALRNTYLIYKYDSNNKWSKIMDCCKINGFRCTIDAHNKEIYAFDLEKRLSKINLITNTIQTLSDKHQTPTTHREIIYENNAIHLLTNHTYSIFDSKSKQFKEMAKYNGISLLGWSSVFIKSRKSIITTIRSDNNTRTPFISEFSLQTLKWTNWKRTAGYNSTIVSTKNQKYVIFFGGYYDNLSRNGGWTNLIEILDVKNDVIKQSVIKCPITKILQAVLTSNDEMDEMLTFGFVNHCFKLPQLSQTQLLDYYLQKIIANYVCFEQIHIFDVNYSTSTRSHWTINVDQIIQSAH
eukprot:228244_1